ncbi:hypothetical protein GCM10009547_44400 [Sporichthya brevicatena]|uniref:Iron-binding zinc finger CDGSH type domain-containing protein n=1 Tax=Sporichthya brevicatena TaxID=171442 RepID=A0ABN1HAJ1_9ACTN
MALAPETVPDAGPGDESFPRRAAEVRRVTCNRGGPVLVDGPIEVCVGDGPPERIDRFRVAICACGQSGRYPLCDGTHRRL